MCGIALIVSGVRIDLLHLLPDFKSSLPEVEQVDQPVFSFDDIKAALLRRGPDNFGSKKMAQPIERTPVCIPPELKMIAFLLPVELLLYKAMIAFWGNLLQNCSSLVPHCNFGEPIKSISHWWMVMEIFLFIMVAISNRKSHSKLFLKGEIFGGIHVGSNNNDTAILMDALGRCFSCNCQGDKKACYCTKGGQNSVPELLSKIKGPWALIYWQDSSKTMWFGRDAFGRRSLLVHWPTADDSRFLLSSVSPPLSYKKNLDLELEGNMSDLSFWEELPCGIYSICLDASKANDCLVGEVRKHEWSNPELKELIEWERTFVEPKSEHLNFPHLPVVGDQHAMHSNYVDGMPSKLSFDHDVKHVKTDIPTVPVNNTILSDSCLSYKGVNQCSDSLPAQRVLLALKESVKRRITLERMFQTTANEVRPEKFVPVAVLFSGGLDSMILAALLDECLDRTYEIDLLNVSFDGESAPDRISARAGVKELQRIAPSRRWNLVEIDADLSDLTSETLHVMSLINPAKTYMDLNIGIALWLAAGGHGWVDRGVSNNHNEGHGRSMYKSEAKILLVGSGADEQCAGYGRHKTKYRLGGWLGLHEEMKLDMHRIWKRNLGRDDRCISDNGKEARFPFLDEDVIRTLLDIPLCEVADLDQPIGRGDKKILREVAWLLGLKEAASLPKRAIQFGSRIARESNRKNFGSNRAANQASAGSLVIHMETKFT
ncbi:PREDICTED: asparagine synthetase domain-containing protein 1 isoform X2 [Nelumbo nucifera]|uniref:Asparagine synthetase domain-containing protein 1 isoform X2 n=1 Tax=Nelumbo nucifera TaxID=4432 RepID=A0A1U7ZUG5_NELNU|nr:PREDICTED: asparagine synthetase domain-containing protein 1 isoform X2 [Nelumbo nucifera]